MLKCLPSLYKLLFLFTCFLSLTLWSRPLRSRCRPSPSCPAEVPAGPPGEDGSGEGVTAVCSPWWPVVRGSSQSRAGHFGGGQRGAPSDESRLIHLSLLRGGWKADVDQWEQLQNNVRLCVLLKLIFRDKKDKIIWTKKQNKTTRLPLQDQMLPIFKGEST